MSKKMESLNKALLEDFFKKEYKKAVLKSSFYVVLSILIFISVAIYIFGLISFSFYREDETILKSENRVFKEVNYLPKGSLVAISDKKTVKLEKDEIVTPQKDKFPSKTAYKTKVKFEDGKIGGVKSFEKKTVPFFLISDRVPTISDFLTPSIKKSVKGLQLSFNKSYKHLKVYSFLEIFKIKGYFLYIYLLLSFLIYILFVKIFFPNIDEYYYFGARVSQYFRKTASFAGVVVGFFIAILANDSALLWSFGKINSTFIYIPLLIFFYFLVATIFKLFYHVGKNILFWTPYIFYSLFVLIFYIFASSLVFGGGSLLLDLFINYIGGWSVIFNILFLFLVLYGLFSPSSINSSSSSDSNYAPSSSEKAQREERQRQVEQAYYKANDMRANGYEQTLFGGWRKKDE
ncbi:hypothetical protein JXR93_13010 [bacterium]|nr:hypothetical protein [bacterium]